MFDDISPRYDFLNHFLSFGIDHLWRKKLVGLLKPVRPARILDVACGTGDLTIALASLQPETIVGIDISAGMLEIGRKKAAARGLLEMISFIPGDAEGIPFPDASFDAVTVAFGVRNFVDRDAGFREILRVLRPGGRLVILEFSTPTGPVFGPLYRLYLNRVLPRIGDRTAGQGGAYGYLAKTIGGFPSPPELAGMLRDAGFAAAGWTPLTGGIVCVHTAVKGL